LRAAEVTAGGHLELRDGGCVHREGARHADTEGDLADGEGLTDTGTVDADDHALEDLDTAAVALDDLDVHLHGVTGAEAGDVVPHGLLVDLVETLHGAVASCRRHRSPALVFLGGVHSPPRTGVIAVAMSIRYSPCGRGGSQERDGRFCQRSGRDRKSRPDLTWRPAAAADENHARRVRSTVPGPSPSPLMR